MNNIVVLVSGILKNDQGQILLLLRGENNKTNKGLWQLPEGKIEFGEQPEAALRREIKEETGIEITSSKILFPISSVMEVNGGKYHILRLIYEVSFEGNICLDDDHESYKWLDVAEIQEMDKTIIGLKEVIEKL